MPEPTTITKTIDICKTLINCGSKHEFSNIKVALIFRSLLFIDSLHDFTDMKRTSLNHDKTMELTRILYKSYKQDLKKLIQGNVVLSAEENIFFDGLLADNKKIPAVLKILSVDVHENNDLKNLNEKAKLAKILARLCFHDEDINKLTTDKDNNGFGIIKQPARLPQYDKNEGIEGITIQNGATIKLYTLKKFIGAIKLTSSITRSYTSTNPIYVLCENTAAIKDNNVIKIDVIEIMSMFFEITEIINKSYSSKNSSISVSLDSMMKKLMYSLKFELQSEVNFGTHGENMATSWGFVHNIICSKMNPLVYPACDNTTNRGYHPDITLCIDSEKGHASKDYLIVQLKNYLAESAIISINKEIPNFTLVRTAASNFDAATRGNFDACVNRFNETYNKTYNDAPSTYTYDITVVAGNIDLLHIQYIPKIDNDETQLKLLNWFSNETDISFTVNNSKTPCQNKGVGVGGFSLSTAIKEYNNNKKDVFALHFKTLTDTGQVFCFHALRSYLRRTHKDTVYIFHTNDTFCGAIASLVIPGTVIERSDQIKHARLHTEENFRKSLYSGHNNVYCALGTSSDKGTYEIARANIDKFQTVLKSNIATTKLLQTLDDENKKLIAVNLRSVNMLNETHKEELKKRDRDEEAKRKIGQLDNKCPTGFVSQCVRMRNTKKMRYEGGKKGKKTLKKKVGKKNFKKKSW
jgi:hypothetical protein